MALPVMVNSRSPIPVQAERLSRIDDRITRLDKQIASGEAFTEPAEDPSGTNRAAQLGRLDSRFTADQRSLDRARSRLGLAETAIVAAGDALLRARDLTLTAANGTMSTEDRKVILREVEVLSQQLLDAANSRDESGRYLFAGSRSGTAPYAADVDGVVQWLGFGAASGAEAAGVRTSTPPRGPDLFGDATTGAFAQLQALQAALAEPDAELRGPAFADVLAGLDSAYNRLVAGQASVGAGLARLETETNRIAAAKLDGAEALAAVKGLDLTAAIAELEALKLTQSAAQGSFTRVFDGTLFDRLG